MKIDPYKTKEMWEAWKEKNQGDIPDISKSNSQIIKQYLSDMEKGINISILSPRGPRHPNRLLNLKNRMVYLAKKFEELYGVSDLTKINEDQIFSFFSDMRNGVIKTSKGKVYRSVETYGKIFKAFWHWHQKVNKKNGDEIKDITEDLDTRADKPQWVNLDENQVKQFINTAKFEYKVLITFILDTGVRSPSELINIRVSDLYKNCTELNIRDEIVKKGSHGRRIKLMLCSELLKTFIKNKELKSEDYIFQITPKNVNKYLKRITVRLFGDVVSEAGKKFSEISMYDFRHISCCYWLPRYKSESALKYRFGWKKSDKIHYYSELLGMRDTISEEDLLIDVTKTELEKKVVNLEKDNQTLMEENKNMNIQMKKIMNLVDELSQRIK